MLLLHYWAARDGLDHRFGPRYRRIRSFKGHCPHHRAHLRNEILIRPTLNGQKLARPSFSQPQRTTPSHRYLVTAATENGAPEKQHREDFEGGGVGALRTSTHLCVDNGWKQHPPPGRAVLRRGFFDFRLA